MLYITRRLGTLTVPSHPQLFEAACRIFSIETSMEISLYSLLCSSTCRIKIAMAFCGRGCTFGHY